MKTRDLIYLIPIVNVWWFMHWRNPYDYFDQNWVLGLFGCMFITPIAVGATMSWLL